MRTTKRRVFLIEPIPYKLSQQDDGPARATRKEGGRPEHHQKLDAEPLNFHDSSDTLLSSFSSLHTSTSSISSSRWATDDLLDGDSNSFPPRPPCRVPSRKTIRRASRIISPSTSSSNYEDPDDLESSILLSTAKSDSRSLLQELPQEQTLIGSVPVVELLSDNPTK